MWHVNTHLGIYKVSTVQKILAVVPECTVTQSAFVLHFDVRYICI